jgi:MtrB/PioB family decaheme-associated outer membrane protein
MRIRAYVVLTALLLAPAAGAIAQETPNTTTEPGVGSVDFGGQFSTINGDEARYQRYKDMRSGGLLDAFKYTREKENWLFDVTANHVGYRDQKFVARFRHYERARLSFTWDQIPLFYAEPDSDVFSLLSATPFRRVGDGEYRINDAVQTTLQAFCPTPPCATPALSASRQAALVRLVNQEAQTLDIRHRRDTALLDASFALMKNTSLLFHFQNTAKSGTQPWFASFGFAAANELPGPVDHRTTDIGAAVEWSNTRGVVKVGYDGSWFTNDVSTLVWDNPLRATDFTYGSAYSPGDGTSQGRADLWPDTSMNMISGTATYKLPARTRAYGNVGFSKYGNDDALLPHTINTAIPVIPLPRQTADVSADVTSLLLGYGGRPTDKAWFNVRYKLYDWNNTTPTTTVHGEETTFPVTEYVRFDQVVEEFIAGPGAEPFSYKRQYFDSDVSYSVMPFTAVRLGYSRETDKRTFREFEHTADNIFRVAVDTTGWNYLQLRAQYDYAHRTGTGLDEEVFDAEHEGFARPRQFDISDRNRNRFTFLATGTPNDKLSINAQFGLFREERPDTEFGVVNTDGNFYSVGVDVTPMQKVAAGLTWGFDQYKSFQRSRQANPGVQETDPTRDWTTDVDDHANSIYAYLDLLQMLPKTDIRYSLDWMDGLNDTTYGLRPDQTIFTTVPLIQLPDASHTLTRSSLSFMYRVSRRFGAGASWYYENYDLNDWAWNDCGAPCVNGNGTPAVPPSPTVTLDNLALNPPGQSNTSAQYLAITRYMYRPYDGNTFAVRVRVFF